MPDRCSRPETFVLKCTLVGVVWHISLPKPQGWVYFLFFVYNVFLFILICHVLLNCFSSQTALKVHCRLEFNVKLATKYTANLSLACLNANLLRAC